MFLHAYNEVSWTNQNTQENVIERTIRATVAAKKTLLSGFTTVRDLGTEGAGDADISLRKCISDRIIPGPRYFTANRAIVSTGAYGASRGCDEGRGTDCMMQVRRAMCISIRRA